MKRVVGLVVVLASFCAIGCSPSVVAPDTRRETIKTDNINDSVNAIEAQTKDARKALRLAQNKLIQSGLYIDGLNNDLQIADQALVKIEHELVEARSEVKRLNEVVAINEEQYQAMRVVSQRWQEEAEKYERKYLKLTKYRWLVFGTVALSALIIIAKIKGIFL